MILLVHVLFEGRFAGFDILFGFTSWYLRNLITFMEFAFVVWKYVFHIGFMVNSVVNGNIS